MTRGLSGDTRIRLSQIDWAPYLTMAQDKHSKYEIGARVQWKSGLYEKTKNGWQKVPNQKDGYEGVKAIANLLTTKKPFNVQNAKLGNIAIVYNEGGHGLKHIIKRRFEEQYRKGRGEKNIEKIKENIAASLLCIFDTVKNAKDIQPQADKHSWRLKKDGFTAIVKEFDGKFLFTGFYNHQEGGKAADSIRRVNHKYRYTRGFLDIYDQVGAVLSNYL